MEDRRRGARAKKRRRQKQKKMLTIVRYLILYAIVGIVAFMAYGFFIEARVRNVEQGKKDGTSLAEKEKYLGSKQNEIETNITQRRNTRLRKNAKAKF